MASNLKRTKWFWRPYFLRCRIMTLQHFIFCSRIPLCLLLQPVLSFGVSLPRFLGWSVCEAWTSINPGFVRHPKPRALSWEKRRIPPMWMCALRTDLVPLPHYVKCILENIRLIIIWYSRDLGVRFLVLCLTRFAFAEEKLNSTWLIFVIWYDYVM